MTRRAALVLVLPLAAAVAGCGPDGAFAFEVQNESDSAVIVNADTHGTAEVPAHSRAAWGLSSMKGGWAIELVDADCRPLATLTVSARDAWLYVAPDGTASLSETSRAGGLAQVRAPLLPRQCPRPRER